MGARTHGGQDPPHRAGAWADGSTGIGGAPHPNPGAACERMRGTAASASVEQGSRAEQSRGPNGTRTIDGKKVASSVPIPQLGVGQYR